MFYDTIFFDKTTIRKHADLNIELYVSITIDGVVKREKKDSHTLDDVSNIV